MLRGLKLRPIQYPIFRTLFPGLVHGSLSRPVGLAMSKMWGAGCRSLHPSVVSLPISLDGSYDRSGECEGLIDRFQIDEELCLFRNS